MKLPMQQANALLQTAAELERRGELHEAERILQALSKLLPRRPLIWLKLANNMMLQGSAQRAMPHFQRALEVNQIPKQQNTMVLSFAQALAQQGRITAAQHVLRERIPGAGRDRDLILLTTRLMLSRDQESAAIEFLRAELARAEPPPEVAYTLARLLLRDDHPEGWQHYEGRFVVQEVKTPVRPPTPVWDGQPMPSGRLLVLSEQGLGDTLQFMRFLRPARQRVGQLLFRAHRPLQPLIRTLSLGADQLVDPRGPLPEHEAHVHLMSLPGLLGADALPRWPGEPYVTAPDRLRAHWTAQLPPAESGRLRVGLVWQGNPDNSQEPHRSPPLEVFAPIAAMEEVELLSLQKMHGLEDLREHGPRLGIHDLGRELDEESPPFMDTAAVLAELDLLISSDTSVAHLAGAMGRPCWLALMQRPEWRWGRDVRTPWYPSMRLFRQEKQGDWGAVVRSMVRELQAWIAK